MTTAGVERKFRPSITLDKSSDVRFLRPCDHCKIIGDRRHMVDLGWPSGVMHGGCALEVLGANGLVLLPVDEQDKLTLGEIGVDAMSVVINARSSNDRNGES